MSILLLSISKLTHKANLNRYLWVRVDWQIQLISWSGLGLGCVQCPCLPDQSTKPDLIIQCTKIHQPDLIILCLVNKWFEIWIHPYYTQFEHDPSHCGHYFLSRFLFSPIIPLFTPLYSPFPKCPFSTSWSRGNKIIISSEKRKRKKRVVFERFDCLSKLYDLDRNSFEIKSHCKSTPFCFCFFYFNWI